MKVRSSHVSLLDGNPEDMTPEQMEVDDTVAC